MKYVTNLKSGENISSDLITAEGEFRVYGGNGLRGYYSKYTNEGNYVLIGRQGDLCASTNYASDKFWASEHAILCHLFNGHNWLWLGMLLDTMNLNQYSQSAAQPGLTVANGTQRVPMFIAKMQRDRLCDPERGRIPLPNIVGYKHLIPSGFSMSATEPNGFLCL